MQIGSLYHLISKEGKLKPNTMSCIKYKVNSPIYVLMSPLAEFLLPLVKCMEISLSCNCCFYSWTFSCLQKAKCLFMAFVHLEHCQPILKPMACGNTNTLNLNISYPNFKKTKFGLLSLHTSPSSAPLLFSLLPIL